MCPKTIDFVKMAHLNSAHSKSFSKHAKGLHDKTYALFMDPALMDEVFDQHMKSVKDTGGEDSCDKVRGKMVERNLVVGKDIL